MRVVLDTNVLARATKSSAGPARELLSRLSAAPHRIVTSSALLAELMRVLEYPRVQALHGLTRTEIEAFVASLFQIADVVPLEASDVCGVVSADPDDDLVILAALRGKAEFICTLDRHLGHPDVRTYCMRRKIRVVSDVALLELLREAD